MAYLGAVRFKSLGRRVHLAMLGALTRNISHGISQGETVMCEADLLRSFNSPNGQPILAGRPYMAGTLGGGIPRYLPAPRDGFPSVVDMTELTMSTGGDLKPLTEDAKAALYEKLPDTGAVLFKGLPFQNPRDLAKFNEYLGVKTMAYEGGTSPRKYLGSNIMTASEESTCFTIEPHNEMSYMPKAPTHISLFCEIPPEPGCGGESVLVANRDFQGEINPEVKEKFKKLGVRYTHAYPSRTKDVYLSWQEVLDVNDRESAERVMLNKGFSYQWHSDESLTYWYQLPATISHPSTGEEIWFNQVQFDATYFRSHPRWMAASIPDEMMPYQTHFGDGTPIDREVVQHIRSVAWKHAVGMQMKQGELLFLDNMLVQHGRLGYVGKRRLLVTLMDATMYYSCFGSKQCTPFLPFSLAVNWTWAAVMCTAFAAISSETYSKRLE